jgi:uncharacterized protein (DUF58 family)
VGFFSRIWNPPAVEVEKTLPSDILKKIRRLELRTRKQVDSLFGGDYHSAFKGQGMDFAEVREYTPGDDVRSIDWNVSARVGEPYVKLFQEERELRVILAVDISRSGEFSTEPHTRREELAELAAVIAFSAERNGDKVGLLLFSDRVEAWIPPTKGRKHALRLVRDLLFFDTQGAGTSLSLALEFLAQVEKKRSIVFLMSDFISDDFKNPLRILSRRHELIALSMRDHAEMHLPSLGLIEVEDFETGQRRWLDTASTKQRATFAKHAQTQRGNLDRLFASSGVDHVAFQTGEDHLAPLDRYLRKRSRRR